MLIARVYNNYSGTNRESVHEPVKSRGFLLIKCPIMVVIYYLCVLHHYEIKSLWHGSAYSSLVSSYHNQSNNNTYSYLGYKCYITDSKQTPMATSEAQYEIPKEWLQNSFMTQLPL